MPPSSSSSDHHTNSRNNNTKKWSNLLPLILVLIFIAEITFLGRLDLIKNHNNELLNSLTDSFYQFTTTTGGGGGDDVALVGVGDVALTGCEEWLERVDAVVYSRDFNKEPVVVNGGEKEWKSCAVECKFGFGNKKADAVFGLPPGADTAGVLRSMESAQYYAENNIATARRKGYNIIMTTSLSSDVPVGYFSWAEYDIMAPVQPKTEKALAAAFISNCAARNFRLQALEGLEKANVKIDSYGGCHRNRDGNVKKVEALKRTIPVVVGPPNIQDFAPAPGSILHIKDLKDIEPVSKTMKYLAANPAAFNESLRQVSIMF
uniref:Glycoprotein 3-alpha-L-fucosyltransferase A-like n=1 Tax=Tanacetum cinerariifolium TaxID=118510 RepID=A0A6L2NTB8_TANCI|nr:glycoprotein 3-alpha-L-fucosyltransferase A-like [Tanacetum cinerariifolium]